MTKWREDLSKAFARDVEYQKTVFERRSKAQRNIVCVNPRIKWGIGGCCDMALFLCSISERDQDDVYPFLKMLPAETYVNFMMEVRHTLRLLEQ